MTQIVALASAPASPWLLSPTQVSSVITEAASVLASAVAVTVVYPSGSPDVIPALAVATVYGGSTTQFDRTAGPWLVITVRTSLALQLVREADLSTVTGTYAVLARITRLSVETNPSTVGLGGGTLPFTWVTKTANYTITAADSGILVDASGGAVTITLPSAVGINQMFAIARLDTVTANVVIINTTSSQTINSSATANLVVAGHSYVLGPSGSNWRIVAGYYPNPMTSVGDMVIGGAVGTLLRLPIGASGNLLDVASGSPAWGSTVSGVTVTGPIQTSSSAASSGTAGAQAGTSPPTPDVSGATTSGGLVLFGTGTGPTAGEIVVVNFGASAGEGPFVTLTPGTAATVDLGLYIILASDTRLTVGCKNAPAASQGVGTYAFYYTIIQ